MLQLGFGGWFQCRLATDPDPSDEPRGVSGATFACAGEPDLDRIIRLSDPCAKRVPGPEVGVVVHTVARDGRRISHPLSGAAVEFLHEPKFDGRNRLLGRPGAEPIHPFALRVANGAAALQRRDPLDVDDRDILEADPLSLKRRSGRGIELGNEVVADITASTGIVDFLEVRERRAEALRAELESHPAPVRELAVRRRLSALKSIERMRVSYEFAIGEHGGEGTAAPLDGLAEIDLAAPWPIAFWMGAWDSDALCGYLSGTLGLPTRGDP